MDVLFRLLVFLFFILSGLNSFSQSQNRNITLGFGKPFFGDALRNENNLSLTIEYENRFAQSFAYSLFVMYARNESYPAFYNNTAKLESFLYKQDPDAVFFLPWSEVSTLAGGIKLHYAFVNNSKWFFSFYLGTGLLNSKSSAFYVSQVDFTGNQITYLDYKQVSGDASAIFLSPGLTLDFMFSKNFFVGFDINILEYRDSKKVNDLPVLPGFFNIGLSLGKKF